MPKFTEDEARAAIASSLCWTEASRKVGLRPVGGNPRTLQRWADRWGISSDHFDPYAAASRTARGRGTAKPLDEVLVENSTYSRSTLSGSTTPGSSVRPANCAARERSGAASAWR